MPINELYELMKKKLHEMYAEHVDTVTFSQYEFFQLYRLMCDMIHIKHITDAQ